jgi:hypothetical protein
MTNGALVTTTACAIAKSRKRKNMAKNNKSIRHN